MKTPCTCRKIKDLNQGFGDSKHLYCPDCGRHEYNDRGWTREEWAEYVEDFSNQVEEQNADRLQ